MCIIRIVQMWKSSNKTSNLVVMELSVNLAFSLVYEVQCGAVVVVLTFYLALKNFDFVT